MQILTIIFALAFAIADLSSAAAAAGTINCNVTGTVGGDGLDPITENPKGVFHVNTSTPEVNIRVDSTCMPRRMQ
jgi:hypothetical protein